MTVTVHLPYALRDAARGASTVSVEGQTVRAVIAALDARFPGLAARILDERGRLQGHVVVFVDGVDIRRTSGLESSVTDGAQVLVQHAMSGG